MQWGRGGGGSIKNCCEPAGYPGMGFHMISCDNTMLCFLPFLRLAPRPLIAERLRALSFEIGTWYNTHVHENISSAGLGM